MTRICQEHPFIDGNKRTAFLAAEAFLERNGSRVKVPEEEIRRFLPKLKEGEVDESATRAWLKRYSRRA